MLTVFDDECVHGVVLCYDSERGKGLVMLDGDNVKVARFMHKDACSIDVDERRLAWMKDDVHSPHLGDRIVFLLDEDDETLVERWTPEELFLRAQVTATSSVYTIYEPGRKAPVWEGLFSSRSGTLTTWSGKIPAFLEPGTTIQFYEDDDVADIDSDRSVPIIGGWRNVDDTPAIHRQLLAAQK